MARQRRYRFRIVRQVLTQAAADSLGEEQKSWADGATYWAGREWQGATEADEAGLFRSGQAVTFYVRGANPITEKDRVKLKPSGEVFRVMGVTYRPEENETVITAERWRG